MRALKHKLFTTTTLTLLAVIASLFSVVAFSQATTYAVAPKHGTCPKGYYYRDQDNSCVKKAASDKKSGSSNGVAQTCINGKCSTVVVPSGGDTCGGYNDNPVTTSINIGCTGQGNPIVDLTFAVIRFLSNGVGLVVVGSIVWAGIQYSASRGDPQAVAAAQTRIRSSVTALLLYIFAYAILNYVIPHGFFKQ